ncbi:hypothetical protein [Myxosarcina sp. GI1]|uniref:hypothetical protein n=1 Tax=Myxosarcina sp. GI1 TaxID=1541065 RepID=UPI000560DD99|nr:hypothetical protein [Myxosarcina sp. GI1]
MLVNRHQNVYLSFISTDLPIWHVVETTAALYHQDGDCFRLLLDRQNLPYSTFANAHTKEKVNGNRPKGIFWLEISPYRVILTMQGDRCTSYRHFWEKGIYGVSRYCLNAKPPEASSSMKLRNYTRKLILKADPYPTSLQIEYELWSATVNLGSYILYIDID